MKRVVLLAVVFVAGIATGKAWNKNGLPDASTDSLATSNAHPIALDQDELRKNPPLIPVNHDDQAGLIYARLGLRNGDGPEEINGTPFPAGFANLVAGYSQGHLCVKYKREERLRQACFDRNQAGEQIIDRGL